jgi:hypothetical protein
MPTAERPRRLRYEPNRGWNAGADGVVPATANCTYTFSVELAEQIVVGLSFDRPDSTGQSDVSHAFLLTMQDAQAMWSIVEYGSVKTDPVAFVNGAATIFKVLRTSGVVTYQVNGSEVYISLNRSSESISQSTSLFAAGDSVINDAFAATGGAPVLAVGEANGRIRLFSGQSTMALRPPRLQSAASNDWPVATSVYLQGGPLAFRMSSNEAINAGSGTVGPFFIQGRDYGTSTFAALSPDSFAQLVQSLGTAFVTDTLFISANPTANDIAMLMDALSIASSVLHSAQSNVLLTDHVGFHSSVIAAIQALLSDSIAFGGGVEGVSLAIEQLVDALVLSGQAASQSEAISAIVSAISFSMLVSEKAVSVTGDTLSVSSPVATSVLFGNRIVDQLTISSILLNTATLVVSVRDTVAIDAVPASALNAASFIDDALGFGLRIKLDTGEYVAYAINTETTGLTKYTNYPFNSFAKIGGKYYGAGPTGLYLLEGSDDAGTPISARARMAFTSLGSSASKRVSSVFLAYTSTGALRLKVLTLAADGSKRADYYRLNAQTTGDMREGRVKIGQGLRSVYWGFEIESIDGAAFEIDLVSIHPLILERRTHGQGGGKR